MALRREIHREPELGLDLPKTRAKVLDVLSGLGLDINQSQATTGLVAILHGARPGPNILLRGDMDALPMSEDTGLPFASQTPGHMHACGHDAHTSMLASAAHLLSQHKENIRGNVLFMFTHQMSRTCEHGRVCIVAAGVHLTWCVGCKR